MNRPHLWLASVVLAGGCSPVDVLGMGGADAGEPVTSSDIQSSTGTSTASTGPAICPPQDPPEGVPAGWVEYTDWSCNCRFYRPGSAEAMPPPFEWEACPEAPSGIACKRIAQSWLGESQYVGVDTLKQAFARDARGRHLLLVGRGVATHHGISVVTEVDGPIRAAVYQPFFGSDWNDLGCQVHLEDVRAGRWALGVEGDSAGKGFISDDFGAIGGPIDEAPSVLLHEERSTSSGWYITESLVWRVPTPSFEVTAHPLDMSSSTVVHSPALDPDGLHITQPNPFGDALFFTTNTLKISGINVWTPAGGFKPFRRWIGDYTRGAGSLGTDGTDLVWSEGEGKQPNEDVFPTRSIMTAPFTTDPNALAPRRLRSQLAPQVAIYTMKVGCGYAAHVGGRGDVVVVRLSDGWAWYVPNTRLQRFTEPLGVTCDEIFAGGFIASEPSDEFIIARIRLDSLGRGVPPD